MYAAFIAGDLKTPEQAKTIEPVIIGKPANFVRPANSVEPEIVVKIRENARLERCERLRKEVIGITILTAEAEERGKGCPARPEMMGGESEKEGFEPLGNRLKRVSETFTNSMKSINKTLH